MKFQRLSSEDCRTPVCGHAVKQSAEFRSAFFATAQMLFIHIFYSVHPFSCRGHGVGDSRNLGKSIVRLFVRGFAFPIFRVGHGGLRGYKHFKTKPRVSCRDETNESLCLALLCWCWRHSACIPPGTDSAYSGPKPKRSSSQRAHREHVPNDVVGKSPFEDSEIVIRRLQNTSSWTGSEAECHDAVCVGVLRNCTVIP